MNKYINFYPINSEEAHGMSISGFTGTPINTLFKHGYWMSAPHYGPDDKDWWRSECGHTVDLALKKCPVCGESRPQ